jgi:hypothetical protein
MTFDHKSNQSVVLLMAFEVLHSFREVSVPPNSLVVLDIDDTVMKFEAMGRAWWAKKEAEVGRDETMRQWIENARAQTPVLIEPEEFPAFLKRVFDASAHLVFLTARSADLRELTEFHLTHCGIEVESHNVYFAREKGACLQSIVLSGGFKQVLFIDDMEHNVEDVLKSLSGVCEIQAYHFAKYK